MIEVGYRVQTLTTPEEAVAITGNPIGAIPLFAVGGLPLLSDPELVERNTEIAFNAGRLDWSVVLRSYP